jgi:hypothetical protein
MTIEEGTGDEFLLTCFVCKNPFGLVAQFCGYCQATRQQALGVERAKPNQQILLVQEAGRTAVTQPKPQPKPQPLSQQTKPQPGIFVPSKTEFSQPTKPKPRPQKVQRKSVFLENAQLRSKRIGMWQKKNSKLATSMGILAFLSLAYFSTQSLIFLAQSPLSIAEERLYQGAIRSTTYFDNFQENSGIRFFPTKFAAWSDSDAGTWTSSASWNGWKGTASVDFLAAGTNASGIPITGKFRAEYSTVFGIFRDVKWVPEAPAVINLEYPSLSGASIYINGLAAGTTAQPAVREGQYQIYPGSFTIDFYDLATGEELTEYSRFYFIDAQGSYYINFS